MTWPRLSPGVSFCTSTVVSPNARPNKKKPEKAAVNYAPRDADSADGADYATAVDACAWDR